MPDTGELYFPILGREIRAKGLPSLTAAWLWRKWRFPEHDEPAHPFQISLHATDRAPDPLVARVRTIRIRPGVRLGWRVRGDTWEMGGLLRGLRATFGAHQVRIALWGADWQDESETIHEALHMVLCESLRLSGLFPLCAGVVARDGHATALAGRPGIGKSSTLLRALCNGAHPVAEDLAWLNPVTLEVRGWDRGIRIRAEGMRRTQPNLPEVAGRWVRDRDGKLVMPWDQLGIERMETATLSAIAVLARRDGESDQAPLVGLRALKVLRAATGLPMTAAARAAATGHFQALLSRVSIFSLPLAEGESAARPFAVADAG